MTVEDHNGARWIIVRWLDAQTRTRKEMPNKGLPAGWYVVRVCPCHFNLPVLEVPCESEADARRAMAKMLNASAVMGVP